MLAAKDLSSDEPLHERVAPSRSLDLGATGLDATTTNTAARIAEQALCRSLDSIHLGAARRAGQGTTLLTFDSRQARAARQIDMMVVGV